MMVREDLMSAARFLIDDTHSLDASEAARVALSLAFLAGAIDQAETAQQGPVHDGAGRDSDNAQNQDGASHD